MTDAPDAWMWSARGAGAVAGSAISLACLLPEHRREAALRFAVGVIAGLVFGGTAGLKIAAELEISERTVETHITAIFSTLALNSRAQLAAWCVEIGLVERQRP
jgi:hypothetical protein